ncbi:hypothetical protein NBRC110019_22760 [Neptunitalea chrysea]|uniref:DUF4369 domain-containing protein n=1 Tax=Neptunitalea chrysea TaxID=1647581 RepID=A0A9W6B5L0_9FLAO|nr:DUF4369 domain-containing protein [Neptunitalea chrysea]GLB53236.1 hypothetical protein NBRC110019_22760 [Neptunitalea chrysea]
MKKYITAILLTAVLISCGKDENTMTINGNIKGLKLGTLYFQRLSDSATYVNIDTFKIDGDGKFTFETPIEEPEVFFIYLDKKDQNPLNDRLMVFGESGEINIESTRDYFTVNAKITGSKLQEKYDEYRQIKSKYSHKNLDWIEQKFKAAKRDKKEKVDSLNKLIDQNTRRSYLYSINYCINNKNSEVAPYVALTDLTQTSVKYLDTINNSLSDNVASSKYGKLLNEYIGEIKKVKDSLKK